MRIVLLIALAAGVVALTATTPTMAFAPGAGALGAGYHASAASAEKAMPLVTIKWKKRPPGWSHGRKVGWQGRGAPPGQLKKRWF
jgi:hypothetical protein